MSKNLKKNHIFLLILVAFLCIGLFLFHTPSKRSNSDPHIIDDISGLHPTHVSDVVRAKEIKVLQDTLALANEKGIKVSIAGKKHSQGGQTFYKDAVVLDMSDFNRILEINPKEKTIRVESGATWEDIQRAVNPYHLSVEVMQAYNIFTVGGSMSVNVHESDLRFGPLVESVKSFHLLLADGSIINVSRTENPELFRLVIGGYGLFGVILDATLELTDDIPLQQSISIIDYRDYPKFFEDTLTNKKTLIEYTRASIASNDSFLKEISAVSYESASSSDPAVYTLRDESHLTLRKFIFDLSRKFDWAKTLRWNLQRKYGDTFDDSGVVSRNNIMHADINVLQYSSTNDTDVLQEYFVPTEHFVEFLDGLRSILQNHHVNLLSVGIRYVPQNTEAELSYSRQNSFAFVLYFNEKTSPEGVEETGKWVGEAVDLAIKNGGTYYLPYQLIPTSEQIRKAYPNIDEFFTLKKKYDPKELFKNQFYAKYALGEK